MTDYPTLLYTSTSEIPPFHLPEAWKKYPFWEEPPRIGHHSEYPPPPLPSGLAPQITFYQPSTKRRFWDNKFHCSSKKLTRSWILCSPVVCTRPLIHPPVNSGDNSHESLHIISGGGRNVLPPIPCITGSRPFYLSFLPLRGIPEKSWWRYAARFSKPWPYFRPNIFIIHTCFQTWPPKARPIFRP